MQKLKKFDSFLNERQKTRKQTVLASYDDSDAEDRIKEIRRRVEAQTGEERLYQTVYDEGGALKRLVGGAVKKLQNFQDSMSELFKSQKLKGHSAEDFKKDKKETLSKWGETLKASGKNKEKDYESFYADAIKRGKATFGKDFDINDPSTKEERIYRDYVFGASKYYDFKPDAKGSKV
jgi:hypothetical protein